MTKGAKRALRNPPSFFISSFTSSKSSNDFMILIISFISSFKINKAKLFPALTTSFLLIFLSNLFIAFEAKLLTNPGKLYLAKGIARKHRGQVVITVAQLHSTKAKLRFSAGSNPAGGVSEWRV